MKKTRFVPLYDKVLVERVEAETVRGGIIIPSIAQESSTQGVVVAVGHGRLIGTGKIVPLKVQKGQHILFGRNAGSEMKVDGKNYLLMHENEIEGYLEDYE